MTEAAAPAVICVSLDSALFTREWIRFALSHTLERHGAVEFFLGDRLLLYNSSLHPHRIDGAVQFDFAANRRSRRAEEMRRFIGSEIRRLPDDDQRRIAISDWSGYSDGHFADVFRRVLIAYGAVKELRERVEHDVRIHFSSRIPVAFPEAQRELSRFYILEETAMVIRIAELGCKPDHYYPEEEISTLRAIYSDEFAEHGVSVPTLTGQAKTRVFTALPLPRSTNEALA